MKINKLYILCVGVVLMASCKKSFIERPSPNGPTLETYYKNAEEVNAATGLLYNKVWYEWQDKAFHSIGEVLSGNMYTGDPVYSTFYNFTTTGNDEQVKRSWNSFYNVAGSATVLIKAFEDKKANGGGSYLDQGIAEARFIRGVAYFDLARTFGDVPIVDDPVELATSGDVNVPRYLQSDVLRFALEDFQAAEAGLPASAAPGRVTTYSAKGMMAKLYLYTKDYANAKLKSQEIISSGKYKLYSDYGYMFTTFKANNNEESLFALQWIASGGYSYGNPIQAYCGPSTLLKPTTGAGYSAIIPSLDMLNAYEFGDKRREWSVMEQGFSRPDWKNVNFPNGFVYDTTYVNSADDPYKIKTGTRTNALKYVVGPGSSDEPVNGSSTSICTYILRYADVLLIYAEATLAGNSSTSDASALDAFNQVRHRAGFGASQDKTSLTEDIILHERRVELAFEGDYWYDIQRQGYEKAKAILAAEERGILDFNGQVVHYSVTLSSPSQLYLPIPTSEIESNPLLSQPAVPYYQ
ncbi:MAG: RagB/SusD family nutrient uptake outer membrane protein [Sphingobacteriaceae bacterium]|nr:MAG: RagB/SusD family nutrient uptake outer membrane protein [Sphingobacteriaceae bacterium]